MSDSTPGTPEFFHWHYLYDPCTGLFAWRNPTSTRGAVKAGDPTGYLQKSGYVVLRAKRKGYMAHRVAWMMTHGAWPECHIDHIDGNRSNNRISNLRQADPVQSAHNRKGRSDSGSGIIGVKKIRDGAKWEAKIETNGVKTYLGRFDTANEASAAYETAAREMRGEFFLSRAGD